MRQPTKSDDLSVNTLTTVVSKSINLSLG